MTTTIPIAIYETENNIGVSTIEKWNSDRVTLPIKRVLFTTLSKDGYNDLVKMGNTNTENFICIIKHMLDDHQSTYYCN